MRVRCVVALIITRANKATVTQLRGAPERVLAAPGSNFSHLTAGRTLCDRRRAPTEHRGSCPPQLVCIRQVKGMFSSGRDALVSHKTRTKNEKPLREITPVYVQQS